MSIDSYMQAKKIIEENEELVDDFGNTELSIIVKAQSVLNMTFPEDYKKFLLDFGSLTFGSVEVYGVFREDFENSGVPDAVWATMEERKQVKLPNNLLIIYNTGMGELYCLNFNHLNNQSEPKVTSYYPGFEEDAQENEVLYDSFGDFLLDMVEEEIK